MEKGYYKHGWSEILYKLPYELLLSEHQFSFVQSAGFPMTPEHDNTGTGNTLLTRAASVANEALTP